MRLRAEMGSWGSSEATSTEEDEIHSCQTLAEVDGVTMVSRWLMMRTMMTGLDRVVLASPIVNELDR